MVDHGCNVDYSTVPPDNKLKLADALIASITSNCHTLPTLLTYSLKTEPEYVINKLVQYNMVDSRISVEVINIQRFPKLSNLHNVIH